MKPESTNGRQATAALTMPPVSSAAPKATGRIRTGDTVDRAAQSGDVPAVERRDSSHGYKGAAALRHVSLSIRPG
ncbi:MAG: hypothetical protein JO366_20740, partial [Methylobacteriaceae bacterium]|nr:hypothetical protein [Methylobacteriaceae bacterium]